MLPLGRSLCLPALIATHSLLRLTTTCHGKEYLFIAGSEVASHIVSTRCLTVTCCCKVRSLSLSQLPCIWGPLAPAMSAVGCLNTSGKACFTAAPDVAAMLTPYKLLSCLAFMLTN